LSAVVDPAGTHRQAALATFATGASALCALLRYDPSATSTLRALSHIHEWPKEALVDSAHLTGTVAGCASRWRCGRIASRAFADATQLYPADFDLLLGAESGLLEGEMQIKPLVAAPLRLIADRGPAEEGIENISQAAKTKALETTLERRRLGAASGRSARAFRHRLDSYASLIS
jgi:hypothetical protein